jgi:hypothetical protein
VNKEYGGIDLHRRRSVIVHKSAAGELVSKTQIVNDPLALAEALAEALAAAVAAAGPEPEVGIEAMFMERHCPSCSLS